MHFLLTNDDGIHAPGLAALVETIRARPGATCTVVAPDREQSQCGHRVTTRETIAVEPRGAAAFAVGGTPADCVRIALFALGVRPDFVLSGVNAGGNLGQDLYISGTVAAAREAAFHGIPAAAFSHYLIRDLAVDWPRISAWTGEILRGLLTQPLANGEYWNVNFPHHPPGPRELPPLVRSEPCRAPLNVAYDSTALGATRTAHRYTATYASRPVEPGSDVAVCFGGSVAVSRLRI